MIDPLSEVVTLLQPVAEKSKLSTAWGRWRLERSETGHPFYCVLLEGSNRLNINGSEQILEQGDFILVPSGANFVMSSMEAPEDNYLLEPTISEAGDVYIGDAKDSPEVKMLVGHCTFKAHDARLLVRLLPRLIHVRGEHRLTTLVELVKEESKNQRPARELVLTKLLEVLLIEALRTDSNTSAAQGLARGLADERLAMALRCIHENPRAAWTADKLAKAVAMSRSVFFERFNRALGVSPMEYLTDWRMALAKDLLRKGSLPIAEVAERVGYGSASSFGVAFSRHAGLPPARFAQKEQQLAG